MKANVTMKTDTHMGTDTDIGVNPERGRAGRMALSILRPSWSPSAAGAGIGLLSWLVFLLVDTPLGMSTEISKFSGCVAALATGWEGVRENAYWASTTPAVTYSTVFLVFTAVGALLSALAGGTFRWETVPAVWRERFGGSVAGRMTAAFLGGAILIYGARMAGGCTSGHGISGTLQLALSGWIFFAVMFVSAIVAARVIFGGRARR